MRRLNAAEKRLWKAYPSGAWIDLRAGSLEADDPAGGADWGREREVRAEVIAELLLGAAGPQPGQVPGVRLAGARIIGSLNVSDATVTAKLHLLNCYLPQDVDLTDATIRTVRLRGCDIRLVRAGRAIVEGLFDLDGSVVHHGVRLDNSHVKGQLRLSVAELHATPPGIPTAVEDVRRPYEGLDFAEFGSVREEWALWAGGLTVDGAAFLRGLRATGGLRLIGAKFHGGLYMQRASITATGDYAIQADFMEAGAAELSTGFTAEGTIRMRGARITGVLSFNGATLKAPGRVLHLSHMQVDEIIMRPAAIEGDVNFGYSRFGVLLDAPDAYPDAVQVNGTVYDTMRGGWTLPERVAWLSRDPDGYLPQPYEQLAAWYRRIGHEPDARRVLLAKQRERRATLRGPGRSWGRLLDLMVGYGYRSWQAAVWAVLLLAVGTTVFTKVPPAQVDPTEVRHFQPLVYSLDLLAPVSVFEVRGAYEPSGWTQWVAWTLVVSGWVLATALIAGVTRVLRPAPGV